MRRDVPGSEAEAISADLLAAAMLAISGDWSLDAVKS